MTIEAYEIADAETTNEQFARFITETRYVTDAERRGDGQTFQEGMLDWEWQITRGANWRHPFGPNQDDYQTKLNHPVTQISAADAEAYCKWAGMRLPTLVEWEVAARAGSTTRYPWGDDLTSGGHSMANVWNGRTHQHNTMEDGFLYTSPVRSFPPNRWGLYDVIGNVFEYCADEGIDRNGKLQSELATGRGGSWWCSANTCNFFNLVDIGQMDRHGSLCNQGFRVVRSIQHKNSD